MITASNLVYRVGIFQPVTVRDIYGAQAVRYQFVRNVWADVKFKKGSRALDYGEVWLPTTIVITTRLHSDINERVRLRWDDKIYQIDSLNRDHFNGSLTITATQVDKGSGVLDGGDFNNDFNNDFTSNYPMVV